MCDPVRHRAAREKHTTGRVRDRHVAIRLLTLARDALVVGVRVSELVAEASRVQAEVNAEPGRNRARAESSDARDLHDPDLGLLAVVLRLRHGLRDALALDPVSLFLLAPLLGEPRFLRANRFFALAVLLRAPGGFFLRVFFRPLLVKLGEIALRFEL